MKTITRSLTNDAGEAALMFLEYPHENGPKSPEFICTVGLMFKEGFVIDSVYGIGEMQALYLGMVRLDALINIHNDELEDCMKWFWEGGMHRLDFGLPRAYPTDKG